MGNSNTALPDGPRCQSFGPQPASPFSRSGIANAGPWVFMRDGEVTFPAEDTLVYALGRYGDVFGPVPVGLITHEAWQGYMFNASLDLIAVALFTGEYRDAVPHMPAALKAKGENQ